MNLYSYSRVRQHAVMSLMESFNIPERGEDEDSPRGVVPAEEAHVARLLRSDSRELLELLRPLREDVQLLREVSELTRLGRGRTLSAGRRRSVRHGDGEGVEVCTGVVAPNAARGWNGGSRQRVLQHLASLTQLTQAKREKVMKRRAISCMYYNIVQSLRTDHSRSKMPPAHHSPRANLRLLTSSVAVFTNTTSPVSLNLGTRTTRTRFTVWSSLSAAGCASTRRVSKRGWFPTK